jgi:hypothetical protein
MKAVSLCTPLAAVLLLAACGGRDGAGTDGDSAQSASAQEALPRPDPEGGSVTGMPAKPGPGPVGPPPTVEAETPPPTDALATDPLLQGEETQPLPPDTAQQAAAAATGVAPAPAEPTPADAVAVVRSYYAALGGGHYDRAGTLWTAADAASHAAPELAAQYGDTASLSVETGAPGRMDAAAGSRYISVPVTINRTLRDGTVRRSAGVVTLRRSVVDGATPDQRAWRIASADLRELPQ